MNLVKKISHNTRIPYFTITPTFSVCPEHGYISGEHFTCPIDGKELENHIRVYDVIGVGALIPVKNYKLFVEIISQLKKDFPEGVLSMLSIQGLGPKKVKVLYKKLHLKSIPELEKACQDHKLSKIEGFGEKTEENISEVEIITNSIKFIHLYLCYKYTYCCIPNTVKHISYDDNRYNDSIINNYERNHRQRL